MSVFQTLQANPRGNWCLNTYMAWIRKAWSRLIVFIPILWSSVQRLGWVAKLCKYGVSIEIHFQLFLWPWTILDVRRDVPQSFLSQNNPWFPGLGRKSSSWDSHKHMHSLHHPTVNLHRVCSSASPPEHFSTTCRLKLSRKAMAYSFDPVVSWKSWIVPRRESSTCNIEQHTNWNGANDKGHYQRHGSTGHRNWDERKRSWTGCALDTRIQIITTYQLSINKCSVFNKGIQLVFQGQRR